MSGGTLDLNAATTASTSLYSPEQLKQIKELQDKDNKVMSKAYQFNKNGVKMKTVFKDDLCKADEFGRPAKYWNPKN